ncbi:MAG: sigma-54-dependent Fis family transcriptional regulator [Verrucomicrobia bacterium]|nr:sigma-54-dependent Fis family transcriptional regulator [Cytophagales bacterium]
MKKILVIDDDTDICLLLNRFLTKNGYQVEIAHKGKDGLRSLDTFQPDLILTDFRLGDIDGGELLLKIKEKHPQMPVIIITGYSDIKIAVNVMRQGAFDYITKPLFPDEILVTVKKALNHSPSEKSEKQAISSASQKTSRKENANGYIFGNSDISQKIIKQIDLVAPTNFSVIIYGETGAGKEAIAQEIHKCSKRYNQPFVAMDCGAISKELAGSELFGHEKGSFTGALNQKIGHFELANGGTLFLDEVSNLSYEVQVSLLRVVQERKVKRIGGTKEIAVDVRIIVASNEKLWESAKNGKFREDLYHRFNEFSLDIPPLRDRKDDIMTFANYFLENTNQELEKNVEHFSQEVIDCFKTYPWYGNLRELKNVIKRATLLTETNTIEVTALPFELAHHQKILFTEDTDREIVRQTPTISSAVDENLKSAASKAEFEMILKVLKQVNFNKTKAAHMLNIDRKTLYNKMKGFDL